MTRELELIDGSTVLVDDDDYEKLMEYRWNFSGRYARRTYYNKGKYVSVLMHAFIMNTPKGMVTDHVNRNRRDNRKSNLRICTQRENSWNKSPSYKTSKYLGVGWNKQRNKWRARIDGKDVGLFETEKEAAKKYNQKAKELHGKYAWLNDV